MTYSLRTRPTDPHTLACARPQPEVQCNVEDSPQTTLNDVNCLVDEHLPKLKVHVAKREYCAGLGYTYETNSFLKHLQFIWVTAYSLDSQDLLTIHAYIRKPASVTHNSGHAGLYSVGYMYAYWYAATVLLCFPYLANPMHWNLSWVGMVVVLKDGEGGSGK